MIVGTFDTSSAAAPAYFGVINYDYLDQARATGRGTAQTFYVRIADPNRSVATSAAIDAVMGAERHANSPC